MPLTIYWLDCFIQSGMQVCGPKHGALCVDTEHTQKGPRKSFLWLLRTLGPAHSAYSFKGATGRPWPQNLCMLPAALTSPAAVRPHTPNFHFLMLSISSCAGTFSVCSHLCPVSEICVTWITQHHIRENLSILMFCNPINLFSKFNYTLQNSWC